MAQTITPIRRDGSPPQYQSIADQLSSSIQDGEYGADALLPTLAELSNRFQVSQITVRHAVRLLVEQRLVTTVPGKGIVVLPRPTPSTPDCPERRAGLLAPFIVEWSPLFLSLPGIFHELGLDLLVRPLPVTMDFSAEPSATLAQLAILRENCGEGLLVFGDRFLTQALLDTRRDDEVFVCLEDFNGLPEGAPLVTTDNFGGMFALTRHLIKEGHRRIAYYRQLREERPDDPRLTPGTTHQRRYAGYREAMETLSVQTGSSGRPAPIYDLMLPPSLVRGRGTEGNWDNSDGRAALADLLSGKDGPTAVVCDNSVAAYMLWDRLHQIGLRVPDDISLVTYDNLPPPNGDPRMAGLTTLDHNFPEIARQAVRLLRGERSRLRDGGHAAPHLLVPPTLIERHSVRPPRC